MKTLNSFKRKPNLIETDDGSEFVSKIFTNLLNENKIERYSIYSSLGVFFAELFDRIIRDLLKKPVFEKGDANWIDVLPRITKEYNNRIHSTFKITPIRASLKKNEGYAHQISVDKKRSKSKKLNRQSLQNGR